MKTPSIKKQITLILSLSALVTLQVCTSTSTASAGESTAGTSMPAAITNQDQSQESRPTSFGYPIVDTGQIICYDNDTQIDCPEGSGAFFGQDAQYAGNFPNYTDNGDGTVTDNVTGLMWQQDPGEKKTYQQAAAGADGFVLAGYDDWRLPTVKELYSLIQFNGLDPSVNSNGTNGLVPFIDDRYFAFEYGDPANGDRIIDSQWATSTVYGGSVFGGQQAMFGVNFADGRIKGYPIDGDKTFFVIYVRGNPSYGINDFADNRDGTITDQATGLTWMQSDSGDGMDWQTALNYCENLELAGLSDWRLPDAKELQSIVDYGRSPDDTGSAAIDSLFGISTITNEAGQSDYPYFWSSTTHASLRGGDTAVYLSFGRAMGFINGQWLDMHGAGAQRSDPKSGDASGYPTGHGPQGDAIRIENFVRCVRGGSSFPSSTQEALSQSTGQTTAVYGPTGRPMTVGMPPQEAIEACREDAPKEACSINTPQGIVEGRCAEIGELLACLPSTAPGASPDQ